MSHESAEREARRKEKDLASRDAAFASYMYGANRLYKEIERARNKQFYDRLDAALSRMLLKAEPLKINMIIFDDPIIRRYRDLRLLCGTGF